MRNALKKSVVVGAAALALAGMCGTASAQNRGRTSSDVRDIVKRSSRDHIERRTGAATGNRYDVSSRDRSGPLASPAHAKGASDFAPKRNVWGTTNLHRDAAMTARRLGTGYTAIVEQPPSPISGRRYDVHTSYKVVAPFRNVQVNTYRTPARATGPHIHVQPNYRFGSSASTAHRSSYRSYGSSDSSNRSGGSRGAQ